MTTNEETYEVGQVIDTEADRNQRLTYKSDGSFPSKDVFLVVDDHVSHWFKDNTETPTPSAITKRPRLNGDNLFNSCHVENRIFASKTSARASAISYCSNYCGSARSNKEWNKIREIVYSRGDRRILKGYETGNFTPLKAKLIVLPNDNLADECSSYAEYKMKCDLKNMKPPMDELQFSIYKY